MRLPESLRGRSTAAIRVLGWLALVSVLGMAMLIRYRLIEPATVAQACDAGSRVWACGIRRLAILTFDHQQLSYLAGAGGVLALLTRSALIAWLTAVVSAVGLVWYCFEPCAVGLVISVLVLARAQIGYPYRQTERHT